MLYNNNSMSVILAMERDRLNERYSYSYEDDMEFKKDMLVDDVIDELLYKRFREDTDI